MPGVIVLVAYAAAVFLATLLDYYFPQVRWYWRVVALGCALALGLTPPLPGWSGPLFDLVLGALFTLLLVWSVSEPVFRLFRLPHHRAEHRA